jgi:hypothetical protein
MAEWDYPDRLLAEPALRRSKATRRARKVGSDFGASVSVYRADGRSPGPEDERRVRAAARALQFTRPDRIGPYDHFDLRFGGAWRRDGTWGLSVGLAEYFIGDDEGNERLDPDAINERDLALAERFSEELAAALGAGYEVIPYSGYW